MEETIRIIAAALLLAGTMITDRILYKRKQFEKE
jgi:hypothetical protein